MCRTLTAFAALSFFESSDGFFDLSAFEGSTFLSFDDLAFGGMSEGKRTICCLIYLRYLRNKNRNNKSIVDNRYRRGKRLGYYEWILYKVGFVTTDPSRIRPRIRLHQLSLPL